MVSSRSRSGALGLVGVTAWRAVAAKERYSTSRLGTEYRHCGHHLHLTACFFGPLERMFDILRWAATNAAFGIVCYPGVRAPHPLSLVSWS